MAGEVSVYSGTTVENYRTCAVVSDRGKVVFDKSREPKHAHPRFYFDKNFSAAVTFGRGCAMGRIPEHTLLVMKGSVPDDLGYYSLDPGQPFPVDKIYVPKPGIDWCKLDTVFDKRIKRHFQELGPTTLLS